MTDLNYSDYKILIVDDISEKVGVLRIILDGEGYSTAVAQDGKSAVKLAEEIVPDLIILDVNLPDMDGFETCKILKQKKKFKETPIIFITGGNQNDQVLKGFEVGGVDYILKPFHYLEVCARVKNHIQISHLLKNQKILINDLKKANKHLHSASRTDPLTGLPNRRDLWEKMGDEIVRFHRSKSIFSIIMTDIDNFKLINDHYGHNAGDYVLTEIAKIFNSNCREQDKPGRWGGEEFLIILPDTKVQGAVILAEKIRNQIEAHDFIYNDIKIKSTMSFGINSYNEVLTMGECLKVADEYMYQAKNLGRNRVVSVSS